MGKAFAVKRVDTILRKGSTWIDDGKLTSDLLTHHLTKPKLPIREHYSECADTSLLYT